MLRRIKVIQNLTIMNQKYIDLKEKHQKRLLSFAFQVTQLLAFFSLAFVIFYIGCSFSWAVFSERDISRAGGWLEGRFYWPGPEMSGGNNLPGPFFYFLLFPAFLMGDSIYSQVALWTTIWFALTYTVAFFFISKITSHRESLLVFLITFILNIYITNYSSMLNPEFAVMFHVLALIGLYYWREKRNSLYLYLTGLVIALGIQVHLLVALHILTVLLFYIIDQSERKKVKTLLLFLLLVFSPVLIYSALKHFQVFETSGNNYTGHINYTLKQIFSEKWFRNIKKFIVPFIPFFTFCFILTLWRKYKVKKRVLKPATKNLFIITAIPFLVAILGAGKDWYMLFLPVLSIILISKWLDDCMPDNSSKKINFLLGYMLCALIYISIFKYRYIAFFLNPLNLFFIENKFILYIFSLLFFIIVITNLRWRRETLYKSILLGICFFMSVQIGALLIFPKSYKRPVAIKKSFSRTWPEYKELYPLMKRIYLETNWPPKTAMKKIFKIGTGSERSLLVDYAVTVEKLNKTITPPHFSHHKQDYLRQEKVQGYFVIQHLQKFIDWTKKDWRNYLSQFFFSAILRQEIKEGKIVIQDPRLYDSFWLIPYDTTESSLFPEGFHNIGQPYYWEEPEWLKKCSQTQKFKNEKGAFYCKVLPGHLQRAGLNIQFSENVQNAYFSSFLSIQFFGPLLGVIVGDTSLDGTMLWSDVQIHLDCNKNSFHWTLPDIGNHIYAAYKSVKNSVKILLAPLKLRIPLKGCKKDDIKRINLMWTEKHTHRGENKESIIWEWD